MYKINFYGHNGREMQETAERESDALVRAAAISKTTPGNVWVVSDRDNKVMARYVGGKSIKLSINQPLNLK